MQTLNPLLFPLHGRALIEASAGTGKTYTIAGLYLRLVLGATHEGDAAAFVRALMPQEILVVTFTDAATEELRERIRARLIQAVAVFRDSRGFSDIPESDKPDAALYALRGTYAAESWAGLARKLDIAAQSMDEAAIYTIHGYCQKMLRSHAFDSRNLFSLAVNTEEAPLRDEVLRDYWRAMVYPLDAGLLAYVEDVAQTPDALGKQILPLINYLDGLPDCDGQAPLHTVLGAAKSQRDETLTSLKAQWTEERLTALKAYLDSLCERKLVNGRSLTSASRQNWVEHLRIWATGNDERPKSSTAQSRLTRKGLDDINTSGAPLPECTEIVLHEQTLAALSDLPDPGLTVLNHAARWVERRLRTEKARRAEIGFDDMIRQLAEALNREDGDTLADVLRTQYPVAMIDEFQDTDLQQFSIFDTIYPLSDSRDHGLFMIGDPKQAIYGFRGGDIHTYLTARRSLDDRQRYTLDTNFRSTHAVVEAINTVFTQASVGPLGAFRHGDIPFEAVKAKGRSEALTLNNQPQPAIEFIWQPVDEPVNKQTYLRVQAAAAAEKIATLLIDAGKGHACFTSEKEMSAVRPRDIAVLVRDRSEAKAIRDALQVRGVRSVYLSNRDSVYHSQEAVDLLVWLRAMAEPSHAGRVRAALATYTLDWPLARLDDLVHNELAWEEQVQRFIRYREIWQQQGVLATILALLREEALPGKLLAAAERGGERSLTNLLHLAERLQAVEADTDGEQGLIRHLAALVSDEQAAAESTLRLESEAELVRVVTLHKSKGLEYPLVFMPFAWQGKSLRAGQALRWRDGESLRIDLTGKDERAKQYAEAAQLDEDIRLIYVGLTRARHALWIGIAPLKETGGLAHLLGQGQPLAPAQIANRLQALASAHPSHFAFNQIPDLIPVSAYAAPNAAKTLADAREFKGRIDRQWWLSSYSSLIANVHHVSPHEPVNSILPERMDDPSPAFTSELESIKETPDLFAPPHLHDFPRGNHAGVFLHDLFEWMSLQGFDRIPQQSSLLLTYIESRCKVRDWQDWAPRLHDWLLHVIGLPMSLPDGSVLPMSALSRQTARAEMEFWLPVGNLSYAQLDALVSAAIWPGEPRPALDSQHTHGMLKGFIDLSFVHQGRHYVLDYKSNHLGPDAQAYTPEAMRAAMLSHRYDLQAALYCLALHRHLKVRLGDAYCYETHMGGFVYLFLRGMDDRGGGQVSLRPPLSLIESLDALFTPAAEAAHV
ncbi:exodeoxyribonuclease V subunit beta [Burkholderiaceae bacterium DAT-1]|nr:exodeoxyribonuclease V subunit beta [Burkholderiaceae bacterium DAT-1]